MSLPCGKSDTQNCEEPSGSNAPQEAIWVGISLGCWLVLMAVVWIVRNCRHSQQRQQALRKVLCCQDKRDETSNAGKNVDKQVSVSSTANGIKVKHRSSSAISNGDVSRDTSQEMQHSESDESDEDFGDESDDIFEDDSDSSFNVTNRVFNKTNGNSRRRSRCSLSSLSITLDTIEEAMDEVVHTASSDICINIETNHKHNRSTQMNTKYTHRSSSVPVNLFRLTENQYSEKIAEMVGQMEHVIEENPMPNKTPPQIKV